MLITPGAADALSQSGDDARRLLYRHRRGDWGELDAHDRAANDAALAVGERVLSAYPLHRGATVWIITEADRSCTTLLLPDEY